MQIVKKTIILFLLVTSGLFSSAQRNEVIVNYINTYKDLAIAEMQRTGVPASIKLAQGIHETMAGQSDLVQRSNNHFGIKCKTGWTGESVSHDDDARGECFRKYPTANDSYQDHSNFLKNGQRYAFLFQLEPTDYKGWAYGLKKAGYATNPKYSQTLIRLIEEYHLDDYSLMAIGKLPYERGQSTLGGVIPSNNVARTVADIQQESVAVEPAAVPVTNNYPSGEFRINDTKVVFAKKGTSFLSIAQQYSVSLARIFEFNEIKQEETVPYDQLLFLQRKRKTGSNDYHEVKPGETLHSIAQAEGVRLESLLEYNLLKGDVQPMIGERVSLRNKAAKAPRLALNENNFPGSADVMWASVGSKASPTGTMVHYTVQPKETIYSIAKKHNVKIADIINWNQLEGYDLKTGQQLKIYK